MTPDERIAKLEEEVAAARLSRDAMRKVAGLALQELAATRELLDALIDDRARCRCQDTPAPTCAQRLD